VIDALLSRTVTMADGRSGRVVFEYWQWLDENGLHDGHRLRVEVIAPMCSHGGASVTSYVNGVDAGDVTTG
jgi:hypothetical protein